MVKYCDRCKFNDMHDSYLESDCDKDGELKKCPRCKTELFEADSVDDIP
ncbi:MAG: hypothetical protein K0Q81_1913 [Paenibacillus sp.]|jgi:hypothetical protein|nr:hypothetical protein [Paenibacillus sp.]